MGRTLITVGGTAAAASPAGVEVQKDASVVGITSKLNVIAGGGVTINAVVDGDRINITIGAEAFGGDEGGNGGAVPTSGFYRVVTIDHTLVGSSDLADFPLLFAGTFSYLKSVANGGKAINGFDIVMVNSAGSALLDYEMVSWDQATGDVEFWVRIPIVSHTTDTTFRVYYGDTAITSTRAHRNGVWASDFRMVLHGDPNNVGDVTDSTGKGNRAALYSGASTVAGKIGQGIRAKSGGYALVDNDTTLSPSSTLTASLWWKRDDSGGQEAYGRLLKKGAQISTPFASYAFQLRNTDSSGVLFWVGKSDSTFIQADSGTGLISNGSWGFVVGTYDNATGTAKVYINGVLKATVTGTTGPIDYDSVGLTLGKGLEGGGGHFSSGIIDEARVASVARTAGWIAYEYAQQNDPASSYAVGSEVAL